MIYSRDKSIGSLEVENPISETCGGKTYTGRVVRQIDIIRKRGHMGVLEFPRKDASIDIRD